MAATIQIKRTANVTAPTTTELATSELAYSQDRPGDGAGAILYIESIGFDGNPVIHKVGGKYYTSMLDLATHLANANMIVKRDSSGNFSAGTITATLYGTSNSCVNAHVANSASIASEANVAKSAVISNTANTWTTPRTIVLSGDASGNVTIDGSSNVTMNVVVEGIGNSGNSNIALFAHLAERANSTTIANTANVALFATNATNANIALFANNSETANTAQQSTFSTLATLAQKSNSTDLATLANVSLFSNNSGNSNVALSSSYSTLSEKSNSAVIANNANNAINATTSVFATNATNANVSLTSGFATIANSANVSNNANNTINAQVAVYSTLSEKSNSAVIANDANNAINANFAITATSSTIANTANAWTTPRVITLGGDVSGNVSLNGSSNVTLNVDVSFADLTQLSNVSLYANLSEKANSAVISNDANNAINANFAVTATSATIANTANSSTYATLAEKSNSSVIANTANSWTTARTIRVMGDAVGNVTLDGSGNANLIIVVTNTTNSVSVADTANALTTPRVISLSGDASGSVVFDGTANVSIDVDVANSLYAENSNISNIASFSTLSHTSNSATIANLANSAVIANNANNAINATTSLFATNATNANVSLTSGFATLAERSNSTVIANLSNSSVIANNSNNSINANVSVYATLAEKSNSTVIANNANNAINATVAVSATYATLSEKSNSTVIANNANNSINATVAVSATYATLAEKSNSSVIANNANNAINATVSVSATYATLAERSNSTVIANLANSAVISNDANNAINAQVSVFATNATNANVSLFAETANSAVISETANIAVFAETSNAASFASTSSHAELADVAAIAESSLFADVATSATVADSANNAINATVAVSATSSTISDTANAWTTGRTITLIGELSGSAEIDGTSDVTIDASVDFANVTVALGTNTSGEYVENVLAGTGITITGQGGEGSDVTVTLNNTAVTPSTYGGASAIPVFQVDQQGRLLSASNVTISTDLLISGNVGSDTVNNGETLRVVGGKGITTNVISNTISIVNSGVTQITGTANQVTVSGGTEDITLSLPSNIVAPGNVTILGQLNVLGNITTTNFATITADDSMIKVANNNSLSDALDIGLYGQYNSGGIKYAGLVRDASDGNWKLFKDTSTEPDNTINFSGVAKATLDANLTGGNVSSLFKAITVSDGGTGNTTFAANAVLMGNGQNPVLGVTGSEGQTMKWSGGKPVFATVADIPAGVDFLLGTANASVPSGRTVEGGNNITVDKTIANKFIIKREALTGDVTSPANSNVLTITSNVVTNLKMIVMPPKSIKLNPLATSNTAQDWQLTGSSKVLGLNASGNIDLITFSSVFSMTGNSIGLVNGSILNGTVDPTTQGTDNDFYINKTNVTLFGPKASGAWPTGINLKGKPGMEYVFGPSTGNNDPSTGKIRFDTDTPSTIEVMRISTTDNAGVDRTQYISSIITNSTIDIISLAHTGTTNLRFRVTGSIVPIGSTYVNIPVDLIAGSTLPGDQEPIGIIHTPGPNVQWDDTAKVLRDASGAEISNPLVYATSNDVPLTANAFTNKAAIVKNEGFPYAVYSEGNVVNTIGAERLDSFSSVSVKKFILPSSGLTWTISNVAGKVRLTTAGAVAHGLTSANAVVSVANVAPVCIKVSSGTGWTADSFHPITAVGTTTIDLSTDHTGQGAPTVVGANTEVEVLNKTLPKLRENSVVHIKFGICSTSVVSSRRTKVYLNNTLLTEQNQTSANKFIQFESGFCNLGQTNLQRGLFGSNSLGIGSTEDPNYANIETKNGNTNLRVAFLVAADDVMFEMSNYFLYIKG